MKPPSASRYLVILAAAVLLVAAGTGCGKKDRIVSDRLLLPPAPDRSTPQNALSLYAYAWTRRDSTILDSLIANDYVGTSIDFTDTLPTALHFTKADECSALDSLERAKDVTAVDVYLGAPSTWVRMSYVGDPPDWVALQVPSSRVTIHTTTDIYIASGMDFEEWKFQPETPAPTSPTDTLWTIVRWAETR